MKSLHLNIVLGIFCVLLFTATGCYDPVCDNCGPGQNQNPVSGWSFEEIEAQLKGCHNDVCGNPVWQDIGGVVTCNITAAGQRSTHTHICTRTTHYGSFPIEIYCGGCSSKWIFNW